MSILSSLFEPVTKLIPGLPRSFRPSRGGPAGANLDPDSLPFKIGAVIAQRYEVLRVVGVGGYSLVYLIEDRDSGTRYALKTLRESAGHGPEVLEQFRKEARLWIALDRHPYIVKADFITEVEGRLCIGMEYVEAPNGGFNSLDGYLKNSPPTLEQSVRWMIQLCRGMEYARAHGIRCHRDMKPANIMIDRAGNVKITDFGFAEVSTRREAPKGRRKSVQQGGFGTPIYMAPEQFMNAPSCDERSDIYSVGIILYQMASRGRLPFFPEHGGRKLDRVQLWAHMHYLHSNAPVPHLNTTLMPVIRKCLEKEPRKRFQVFKDLRLELETVLREQFGKTEEEVAMQEPEAWEFYNRGFSLANLGDFEGAIVQYERALEKAPKNADAWNNKGICLRRVGKTDEALQAFVKAVEIHPSHLAALRNLGITLRGQGRLGESLPYLGRAVQVDPLDEASWLNKALVEEQLGCTAEAAASFKTFLALPPSLFSAYEKHARAFLKHAGRAGRPATSS